jgi:maspardin
MKLKGNIALFSLLAIAAIVIVLNNYKASQKSFHELYKGPASPKVDRLDSVQKIPSNAIEINGVTWNYLSLGKGERSILFLHGMAGASDIWWNQFDVLKDSFRIIALTYPAVSNLREMGVAAMAILDRESIGKVNIVGSSLGGYFAQYLTTTYPLRIQKVVFGNTFPPNEILEKENKVNALLMRYSPAWLVMDIYRGSIKSKVMPTSSNDSLLEAYLLSTTYVTSREQLFNRYRCVIDKFKPVDLSKMHIQAMIFESDNDPLVKSELREQLKRVYPTAKVFTFSNAGHFPYVNESEKYNEALLSFLKEK